MLHALYIIYGMIYPCLFYIYDISHDMHSICMNLKPIHCNLERARERLSSIELHK